MKQRMLAIILLLEIALMTTCPTRTNSQAGQLIENDLYEYRILKSIYLLQTADKEMKRFIQYELDSQLKIEELAQQKINEQETLEEDIMVENTITEELSTEVIYNPDNLLEVSNITREQAYKILEGTALQALSNAFVYMEELYGINAIFLIALSAEESSWGTSSLAITNNNIGGLRNSDGSWMYFDSWGECLEYKASLLKNQYLSESGAYFNGYSIWDVNTVYSEGSSWSENINRIANELLNKIS